MMNKTDRDNWRKFLGIKDPQTALDAARIGGDIGKTAGRSGGSIGGGSFDGENPPEGEAEEGAEKGDGGADAGEKLKVGDKFDRLEDLYDCETGEKVTIDGFGDKGSEQYPSGLEDCNKKPCNPDEINSYYKQSGSSALCGNYYGVGTTAMSACQSAGHTWSPGVNPGTGAPASASCWCGSGDKWNGGNPALINKKPSPSDAQAICDNESGKWPEADKNHLNWNKEKGCFEPLCPELNTAVSDKFKDCQKERILCDKDRNKVKVEVDGNTVKVTQAKYNQTAEIKNGKVQSVKKLTESQTEAEFK